MFETLCCFSGLAVISRLSVNSSPVCLSSADLTVHPQHRDNDNSRHDGKAEGSTVRGIEARCS